MEPALVGDLVRELGPGFVGEMVLEVSCSASPPACSCAADAAEDWAGGGQLMHLLVLGSGCARSSASRFRPALQFGRDITVDLVKTFGSQVTGELDAAT